MVGEGCFLTAGLTLEPRAGTGRGIWGCLHPQHRGLKVGRKSGPLGSVPDSGENRLAAGQRFYSTEGNSPSQSGDVLVKAWTSEVSSVPPSGRAKSPPAEFLHAPRLALLSVGQERNVQQPRLSQPLAVTLAGCVPSLKLSVFNL